MRGLKATQTAATQSTVSLHGESKFATAAGNAKKPEGGTNNS
jgi:hypothetical protein